QLPASCDGGSTIVYPQPVLTDIEFDVDGAMILGFMDRLGHQLGYKNYPPQGTSPLISGISGGDILRAFQKADNLFQIENNAKSGIITTGGANNNEGPGGGEFYYRDVFEGQINNLIPAPHAETAQGGIAFLPGSGEGAPSALDPYSTVFNSGGINWMNNKTAAVRDPGYVLYRSSSSSISNFSKANGLGDLTYLCGFAPLQIGGFVWKDDNTNGIQDACEAGLPGIKVTLFSQNGANLGTTTTNAKGEYFFQNSNLAGATLQTNTNYFVVAGTGGQFSTSTRKLNGNLFLTVENTGMAPFPDQNDSDGVIAGAGTGSGNFTGLPFVQLSTGGYGYVNHSFDFGFTPENTTPVGSVSGFVWEDADQNGIQNQNENGIQNVVVKLFFGNNTLAQTTTTNAQGLYSFQNVEQGTYYVLFEKPAAYIFTLQNAGNGSNDSDPNPGSGQTASFNFNPANGDLGDIDAGLYIPKGSISGYCWNDSNKNGIQNNGEQPLANVTVRLFNQAGTLQQSTQSDASGNYIFTGVTAGSYYVKFEIPAAYVITLQNTGNGANDSDPNPSNGQTSVFVFNPQNGNTTDIDCGFFVPSARILGFCWNDQDADGLQDTGEPGIEGVTVRI
ncbi:MAG TPA: SdrD B-like domain-containing protein, partial [Saprospiraceae bacterium]|nr:SdrD B-like domain-containing protein [Saprospiraceae bacterium]